MKNVLSVKKEELINPCLKFPHWFFWTGEIKNGRKIAQCYHCLKLLESKHGQLSDQNETS